MHGCNKGRPSLIRNKRMGSIQVHDKAFQALIHSIVNADDLLAEILLLAPVKSLTELKFVSRRWHSLITNPSFSFSRSQKIEPAGGIFFVNLDNVINFVPFGQGKEVGTSVPRRLNLDNFTVEINHSCNGLLCCYARGRPMEYHTAFVYIYNPTTNRCHPIPDPTYTVFNRSSIWSVNLAFEPKQSPYYKVICVFTPPDRDNEIEDSTKFEDTFKIGVYSSETDQWKHAAGPFKAHIYFRYGVFWNGAICWDPHPYQNSEYSFYFHVDEERVDKLVMPPNPADDREQSIMYFGESNGHLSLIRANKDSVAQFNIYELEEDFAIWSVKYSVDLEAVMNANPESIQSRYSPTSSYRYAFGLMCLVRGQMKDEDFILLRIWGKLIRYNISQRNFSKLSDLQPVGSEAPGPFIEYTDTFLYIESLAQV